MPQPDAVDYRALLVKYVRHVVDCEGVDYVLDGSTTGSGVQWTEREWAALVTAAREAQEARHAR